MLNGAYASEMSAFAAAITQYHVSVAVPGTASSAAPVAVSNTASGTAQQGHQVHKNTTSNASHGQIILKTPRNYHDGTNKKLRLFNMELGHFDSGQKTTSSASGLASRRTLEQIQQELRKKKKQREIFKQLRQSQGVGPHLGDLAAAAPPVVPKRGPPMPITRVVQSAFQKRKIGNPPAGGSRRHKKLNKNKTRKHINLRNRNAAIRTSKTRSAPSRLRRVLRRAHATRKAAARTRNRKTRV
jgi:hypothetical protein